MYTQLNLINLLQKVILLQTALDELFAEAYLVRIVQIVVRIAKFVTKQLFTVTTQGHTTAIRKGSVHHPCFLFSNEILEQ